MRSVQPECCWTVIDQVGFYICPKRFCCYKNTRSLKLGWKIFIELLSVLRLAAYENPGLLPRDVSAARVNWLTTKALPRTSKRELFFRSHLRKWATCRFCWQADPRYFLHSMPSLRSELKILNQFLLGSGRLFPQRPGLLFVKLRAKVHPIGADCLNSLWHLTWSIWGQPRSSCPKTIRLLPLGAYGLPIYNKTAKFFENRYRLR